MNHLASGNRGEVGNGEIQVPATNYGRPERAVGAVPHRQHGRCQQRAAPIPPPQPGRAPIRPLGLTR